jgi:hypothetical protein
MLKSRRKCAAKELSNPTKLIGHKQQRHVILLLQIYGYLFVVFLIFYVIFLKKKKKQNIILYYKFVQNKIN